MEEIPLGSDVATATSLESSGQRVAKKRPPSVISNQLRDELIRILRTGDDKHDGAFTVAVAARVEKIVVAAREILMTESLAQNDIATLVSTRRHPYSGPWSSGLVGEGFFPPPAMIGTNENFGVQAVRQFVDGFRTIGESPARLVEALAVARTSKLTDVVAVLEKKLGLLEAADSSHSRSDKVIVTEPYEENAP